MRYTVLHTSTKCVKGWREIGLSPQLRCIMERSVIKEGIKPTKHVMHIDTSLWMETRRIRCSLRKKENTAMPCVN